MKSRDQEGAWRSKFLGHETPSSVLSCELVFRLLIPFSPSLSSPLFLSLVADTRCHSLDILTRPLEQSTASCQFRSSSFFFLMRHIPLLNAHNEALCPILLLLLLLSFYPFFALVLLLLSLPPSGKLIVVRLQKRERDDGME